MTRRGPFRLEIPTSHIEGIGRVCATWPFVEGGLERIIWRLTPVDDNEGQALTTHMSLPQKIDAMLTLASIKRSLDSDVQNQIKALANKIRGENGLAARRNEIIHSRVIMPPILADEAIRMVFKMRGKRVAHAKPVTSQEYFDLADDMAEAVNDIVEIIHALRTV